MILQTQHVHRFLLDYFQTNQCQIIESTNEEIAVELTIDIDKQLMNRPFYWHYLEKTGGEPKTTLLRLSTNATKTVDGSEKIHFGSPRLHQIFNSCRKSATHIRLYENKQTGLYPWLCVNATISYQCDQQKSQFVSLGLNLINGEITEDFLDQVAGRTLSPRIADMSYTLHPFITLKSGMRRIENHIDTIIAKENDDWSRRANKRMEIDLQLLNSFYMDIDDDQYEQELEAITNLYKPEIHVHVVNGGLFYLADQI